MSLFSKMGDKGEGGVKNLQKWVMFFMDGPFFYPPLRIKCMYEMALIGKFSSIKGFRNAHVSSLTLGLMKELTSIRFHA